jgi:hypothetical protein
MGRKSTMKKMLGVAMVCGILLVPLGRGLAAWQFTVPERAIGFKFGGGDFPGLKSVPAGATFGGEQSFGFVNKDGLAQGGDGSWPDPLSGSFLRIQGGKPCEFRAQVPNGEYLVWLCAGRIIRADLNKKPYVLKLNELTLWDETPTDEVFDSDKYLHRFVWTQFSRKPHAAWNQYVDVMYPSSVQRLAVTNGLVALTACNYFLNALILVPAQDEGAFREMVAEIRAKRIEEFERTSCTSDLGRAYLPRKKPGDGDYLVYIPEGELGAGRWVYWNTEPTDAERKRTKIQAAGARGERVLLRVAVVPFAELGRSTLAVADLKGPGTIPAGAIKGYFHNNICMGKQVQGGVLLPSLTLDVEDGITQCFWLLLNVPRDAKPGMYQGVFTFKPGQGQPTEIPVEFEVYPFALEAMVPASFGFWGFQFDLPDFIKRDQPRFLKVLTDRCERLHDEIGLTSAEVGDLPVSSANKQQGFAKLHIDPVVYLAARKGGMAQGPGQELLMANVFAAAGRTLRDKIGADIGNPDFDRCFQTAMRQYRDFLQSNNIPLAAVVVDEPRQLGLNAWNQNLANTLRYADLCRAVTGLTVAVTVMADRTHGADFTVLVDRCDIISTHAWDQSRKLMEMTIAKNKTLWLFNVGTDRYSWGFYNWAVRSTGRWEWHLCWMGGHGIGGSPGVEWHNPWLTPRDLTTGHMENAPHADPRFKGAILFYPSLCVVGEGITDYTYIYTLEQALKQDYSGARQKTAEDAKAFLVSLRKTIPRHPEIRGMASVEDGPKVGMGINDHASAHVRDWRRKIAGYLKDLNQ